MKEQNDNILLRLNKELKEKVVAAAKKSRMTRSALAREALIRYIDSLESNTDIAAIIGYTEQQLDSIIDRAIAKVCERGKTS